MRNELHATLETLYQNLDVRARLQADPVAFVHRYSAPADQEVAAVFASALAFGRVSLFRPVLEAVFAIADRRGGPRAWVEEFGSRDAAALDPLYYRWTRGSDLAALAGGLRELSKHGASLERFLGRSGDIAEGLAAWIDALRAATVKAACAATYEALPRGTRVLMPSPADGSACKRWFMFLRWMIRSPEDGIDLGLWSSRTPAELLIPLDTHVARIARFVGLTARKDDSLRTAREVTAALRLFDPQDPVRFDFALAHLGISGACRGHRAADVCPGCPLLPVCEADG